MRFALFALYVLTGLLLLEGLAALLRSRSDPARVKQRLQDLAAKVAEKDTQEASMVRGGGLVLPSADGMEKLLYQAGGPLSLTRFILISLGLAGLGFLGVYAFTGDVFRAGIALLLGLAPYIAIRQQAAKRMAAFEQQLPEALDLLTRSLRTGHALGSGFQMVGDEFDDPIGTEFALVAEEIRLGLDVREALENLMRRVDNDDLPYFTTAVLIQRQTGGNLAELLDKLGKLLRERIQFTGRVRALTAQGRGAATFLALWLPFIIVLMMFVAPQYLAPLFETGWGRMVLISAFGVDILAYLMARRIADVQA